MSGFVYFFVTSGPHDKTMCKIGFTKSHPERRRREVQGMCPVELELFAYVRGDLELEKKLHRTFAPLNYHGEWFVMDYKLHDFVFYLLPDGQCGVEPTSQEWFEVAICDCVLAEASSHPSMDHETYVKSADMSEWAHFLIYDDETLQ